MLSPKSFKKHPSWREHFGGEGSVLRPDCGVAVTPGWRQQPGGGKKVLGLGGYTFRLLSQLQALSSRAESFQFSGIKGRKF